MYQQDPIERLRAKVRSHDAELAREAAALDAYTARTLAYVKRRMAEYDRRNPRRTTPPRSVSTGRAMTPDELRAAATRADSEGHHAMAKLMRQSANHNGYGYRETSATREVPR